MLLGVIADTHDNVDAIEHAVTRFEEFGVETVLHCGDVIAPPTVDCFEGYTIHAVLGNNDGEILGLQGAIESLGNGSTLHGRFASLTIDGVTFAILHGEDKREVIGLAAGDRFDVVCYGHHHEIDRRTIDGTIVVNPGGHFPTVHQDHRGVAIIDTDTVEVTLERI